ncbi:ABC transporter substrate-binding protein [Acuticoccus mangrovi]|uniref:ABC transporter substrate-binding protein n=1 Tax=Acuticoccus mangrovi TaxID=2796142 RepID=A0A934ILY0_9HYPH|nr:ABC transporter substrate-binding protein [Acuticoccus mangrovi]MBJ3774773.1 ABC transporter substrate-binding protein [Acuticoccus mangrovi]
MTKFASLSTIAGAAVIFAATAASADTIRIAEADTFSGEDLVQLIAYANAEARGVDIEVVSLKSDDIVFQAVLGGQVDVGVGDSYQAIANLDAPVRNLYQIRKLAYIPVVDKTVYTDWQDLDGQTFTVHSRGSGTETLARIVENKTGIHFSDISYVPGSEVRVVAMQRGNIKATYLDLTNSKILIDSDPERFAMLPTGDQDASDSTLYINTDFLAEHEEAVQILLEELVKAAKATNDDPSFPAAERERLGLLPDLTDEAVAEITPYFERAVEAGIFPIDGGGRDAAAADLSFLELAGQIENASSLDPEKFWDFAPLDNALASVN